MKRNLLLACGFLGAAATLQAAAPEGNMYILGLNGDNTPSEANCLVMGERSEDDVDEGIWRWVLPSIELTVTEGTLTLTDGVSLSLGFKEDNEYGITNDLTPAQSMLYLAQNGPAVNYALPAGEYSAILALFEDLEGDMGGDSWILQLKSLGGNQLEESIYLLGFNGNEEASAACRFQYTEFTEDGETYSMYKLPRYFVSECPDGFTVLDGKTSTVYGLNDAFGISEVTDESPMAFLAEEGPAVKCSLKEGYYDINLTMTGAMTMVSFIHCEDQTAQDELEYYLVGLNGVDGINDTYKFIRSVISDSYVDEDTGEVDEITTIVYSLSGIEVKEAAELTVVAQDEYYTFGYNNDMAAFLPNDFNTAMPFASLVEGGEPVNCTLEAGKYDFSFSIVGVNMGMLSALPAEEGAVDGISAASAGAVYYNLQGVRVQNPDKGLFIKVEDGKTSKVIR